MRLIVGLIAALSLLATACGGDSSSESTVESNEDAEVTEAALYAAATFSDPATIDNQWLPLTPGTQITLEGSTLEGDERIPHTVITTVTDFTKVIDGVRTVVIWDQDFADGELVETELAFFAQDDEGNVWRMGEYPEEYEDGELVEAPAWLAGLEGAVAGVAMPTDPQPDTPSYSQGWGPEVDFIDRGQVGLVGQETCVPVDCYDNVLVIDEFNVDEPGAFQTKFFVSGIGNVRVGWRGTDEGQEELEMTGLAQLDDAGMQEVREAALALEASAYEKSEVYAETEPLE